MSYGCPCKSKKYTGGFHDVFSFRSETGATPSEISDAEIVLLIESDKAHIAAQREKQRTNALHIENAKLRAEMARTKGDFNRFDRQSFDQLYWLDQITSPVKSIKSTKLTASMKSRPLTKPTKPIKPTKSIPSTKSTKLTASTKPTKSIPSTKPTKSIPSTKSTKPIKSTKLTASTKPAKLTSKTLASMRADLS